MWKLLVVVCIAFSTNLSAEIKILAFSGSSREDSANKKLIQEAASIAREKKANVTVLDLKDYPIPFYDGDLETKEGMPLKARQLRQLMIQSNVIVIASPEYNGSLPAVLKNVIDWASRSENGSYSLEAFKGKKFIIMSASPGGGGGARGLTHLRTILENLGGTVLTQQLVLPDAYNAFNPDGHLKDPKLKSELQQLMEAAA